MLKDISNGGERNKNYPANNSFSTNTSDLKIKNIHNFNIIKSLIIKLLNNLKAL